MTGSGGGAGSGWCVHLPKARLITTPGKADVNGNWGTTLEFEATEPAETAEPPTAEPQPTAAIAAGQPVPVEAIDWPPQVIVSDPLPGQEVAANCQASKGELPGRQLAKVSVTLAH